MKHFVTVFALLTLFLGRLPLVADVVINEFVAANKGGLADEDGEQSDWLELYNSGGIPVNLAGWYLSDELAELDKWEIPQLVIAPGGYHVVFASNKNRRDPAEELHTNFKLSGGGEFLGLVQPDGETIAHSYSPEYPNQLDDTSYGIASNIIEAVRYFETPTPGAANGGGYAGLVKDTRFSVDRGFYTNAFNVAITTKTENATIHYTLDGSTPTQIHGTEYTAPITVSGTTLLRAMAWKPGHRSSDVDTQTYLFVADVVMQDGPPTPDWPAGDVNGQNIDYGMDTNVTYDVRYRDLMDDALLAIPTLSLVTDLDNLFGAVNGIYVNASSEGDLWERATSVELLNPDGSKGFQENAGLRIRGGASRNAGVPKHGFRLRFRSEYGASSLRFPIFGPDGPDVSNGVDLRCSQTPGWHYFNGRSVFARDVYSRDLQIAQGQPSTRGHKYHLYLNGTYWGIYETQENIEQPFMANNWGGEDEDYDIISKKKHGHAIDGSEDAYRDLWVMTMEGFVGEPGVSNYFRTQGLAPDGVTPSPSDRKLLDVTALADYMLVHYWAGEKDGMRGAWGLNNYICAINRKNPDGFKYFKYDSEWSLDVGIANTVSRTDEGTSLSGFNALVMHGKLIRNDDYLVAFADRLYKHFFNDGTMTTSNALALFRKRTDEIDMAIIAESARWGDADDGFEDNPKTRDDDWIPDVNTTVNWIANRTATALSQIRVAGWYPQFDPPTLNQFGGVVTNGFNVSMTSPNPIYYTLDGTDPREIITGNVQGALYSGAIPLTYSSVVKSRTRNGAGDWSALSEAVFAIDEHPPLILSEVMYNPQNPVGAETNAAIDSDAFEFLELQNAGAGTLGLAGLHFADGITFDFTHGDVLTLAPGESVLVVSDRNAFATRYTTSGLKIAGEFTGSLDNGGERLTLMDARDQTVFSISYNDARGWPITADGVGHSLIPQVTVDQLNGLLDYGGHWRASGLVGGSPGAPDPAPGLNVVINEIGAHTDTAFAPPLDSDDWIELHNPSGVPIDVSGWTLSDDFERLQLYPLPPGSIIAAGGFLTVTEIADFHTNRLDGSGFGLNKAGESVYLTRSTPSGLQVVDAVDFKGQANGVSLGRYPDGAPYVYELASTTNAPNAAPQSRVVISELMVSPLVASNALEEAATHEYVEMFNPTGGAVDLWTVAGPWRLDGGIEYDFPSNITLQASEYIVVVSFDPQDSIALNDFLDSYGLTNGQVRIFGPYRGRLDNRTERVAIERPQEADALGESESWIIVDEAVYFVDTPWPTGTDGTGASLQRSVSPESGRDPGNWFTALEGTPGVPGTLLAIASPASGSRYFVPDSVDVNVAVEAQRVSNSVVQVEILEGENVLCVVTQAPYRCTLVVDEARTYFLSAVMTDAAGTHTSRLAKVDGLRIEALAATAVTDVGATCMGALVGSGDVNVALYWGNEDGGESAIAWDHIVSRTASGGTPIAIPVSALDAGETYYYRFRANVDGRFAWSTNTVTFQATPLDDWSHKVTIGFPWAPADALQNFPVLIKLHSGISGFAYDQFASGNGNDLRLRDGAHGGPLHYEIEQWNTGGVSHVWVQVPQLTSNSTVVAYWGHPAAAAAPPAYAVDGRIWQEDYASIWHLDLPLRDATQNYPDAAANGASQETGIVGQALTFDGSDHAITNGPPQGWYGSHRDGFTVSMWLKPNAASVSLSTAWGVTGDSANSLYMGMNRSPFVRKWDIGYGQTVKLLDLYGIGQWQHVALVMTNGQVWTSFNGNAPVMRGTNTLFTPAGVPTLGGRGAPGLPFNGDIDELRISPRPLSGAWLRAEYDTVALHDTETEYGTVDTGTPNPDQDGDGMPDAWEQRFPQGTAIEPGGNNDTDLLSNYQEFIAGTDPTNATSTFELDVVISNNHPYLRFYAIHAEGVGYEGVNRKYALECATGLTAPSPWTGVPGFTNMQASGQWISYTNLLINAERHYRARVWLEDTP